MIMSCVPALTFAADAPTGGIAGMEDYLQYSASLSSDGYIGIPVDIYTYHKDTTTSDMPIVCYVINTNTERVGTDSDEKIVKELVNDKNCIVVVIDYKNNPLSVCPDLDWSVQGIRTNANNAKYFKSTSIPYKKGYTYVVPQGYNITLDEFYWAIDKHGADGTLDYIVNVWNNDFKGVKGNQTITYPNGTTKKVSEVTAESIYDCVKKDGTPIDLDLRMDIIYPTNPDHEVPVYICASSSETRIGTWTSEQRPHLSGFLFSGYAGVIYDYGYVPMARNDHYGYFDGDGSGSVGGVTGENGTYSVSVYNATMSDTAAIRKIRWLADYEGSKYKFDVNKFGIYGNSKAGGCIYLGEEHPEKRGNRYFDGHYGETRYDNGDTEGDGKGENGTDIIRGGEQQPWLTYKDGTEIPSNVQFAYGNCGGGYNSIMEGHAPLYASGSMKDGSYQLFYPGVVNACRNNNVPCLYLSMPDLGHALVYGKDKDYGLDGYAAFFDMAHYYLKGAGPILEYIDMGKDLDNVDAKAEIKFKFAGTIPEDQIKKITVKNTKTGEVADGSWSASFGDTEWVFKAKKLDGGAKYLINVPTTITGDNGANLQKSKTLSFTVKPEMLVAPEKITGDDGLTLLKSETADNAVYSLYTGCDFADSTTTDLRFAVTNDAANSVLIYALDDIDETNLKNSKVGELLGEIVITGKGDYDLDITDYVKSLNSNKAAFMFKAKKNKETKVISKYDFESDTVGSTSPNNVKADARAIREVSTEQNATDGGSNSLKIPYMQDNNYKNGKYHVWIPGSLLCAQINSGVTGSALTANDLGRKFNVSFKVYDETSRRVTYQLTPWSAKNYDNIDWNSNMYSAQTNAGQWNTYSFDYRIDKERDIRTNKNTIEITLGSTLPTGKTGAAYIDDITVTESVSEVDLADENSEILPSLVLHPADYHNLQPKSSAYVESGANAENEMTDGVFVSGRAKAIDSNAKKTYIKLDLSVYDGGQAYFGFKTTASSKGKIKVYGLEDTNWSKDTINYYNAPANDRFGYGIAEDKAYGKTYLDTFNISGEGEYSLDVTNFAEDMKAAGKNEATLVFINEDKTTKVVYENDFSNSSYKASQGGGLASHGIDFTQDHTTGNGSSYKMTVAQNSWERLRFRVLKPAELTTADIGRSFKLTYWVKATAPMRYYNSLMNGGTADNKIHQKFQTVTKADTWQKMSYEFTLDASDISQTNPASLSRGDINFESVKAGESIYIDDMVLEELGFGNVTIIPSEQTGSGTDGKEYFTYSQNFEDLSSLSGYVDHNGLEYRWVDSNGVCWVSSVSGVSNVAIDKAVLSTEDNSTFGGKKSAKFITHANWNRFRFTKALDTLTEDKIGTEYKVSFMLKADHTGYINTGIIGSSGNSNKYTNGGSSVNSNVYAKTAAKLTVDEANVWKKYTYTFTVDKEMVDKNLNCILINPQFGQSFKNVTGTDPANKTNTYSEFTNTTEFYIDDIYSTEIVEGAGTALSAKEAASVSANKTSKDTLYVCGSDADSEARFIRKAYICFDGGEYEKTQKATLAIDVEKGNGQTVYVWALTDEYPDRLTYTSAPGYSEYEGINNAYGGTALASFTADQAGVHYIDVTDYVKAHAPNEYIFAITSEDNGGCEYISYDFERNAPFAKDIDYTAFGGYEGSAVVNGGELNVSGAAAGQGIKLLNVFGDEGAAVNTGEEYSISIDVTSGADSEFTIGAINADGKIAYSANYALTADNKQTITLSFTATKEDADDLINAIYVETANAADFKIDNVTVSSRSAAAIGACELDIETAKENPQPIENTVSVTLSTTGDSITVDGENMSANSTKDYAVGRTLALSAIGEGTFMYWKDADSGLIVSYDKDYEFTVGSSRKLIAIFAENGGAYVTFKNINGFVMAEGLASSLTVPNDPYVYGYEFKGWYKDGEISSYKAGEQVTDEQSAQYIAGFGKKETAYEITINGEKKTYSYNDKVTVIAEAEKDGKTFSYWAKDGKAASYDKEYSFFASADSVLEAVYGENAESKNVLVMANPVMADETRIAFFAERNISSDCEIIETGVLMGKSAGLTLDNTTIKAVAKSKAQKGQFTVRKKGVVSGETWYARAYVIYRDSTGSAQTIYSNEVSMTVK